MWKRGEIAPKEQFLLFSTLFYIYISNFSSQITYSFVKSGCSIYCFPHSLNSDMSSTDISKCFSESLEIRDNESRLYLQKPFLSPMAVKVLICITYRHISCTVYRIISYT